MSLVTATYREVCPESITKIIGDPTDPLACGPTDVRCNDPEFALQNPDKCGSTVTIRLKPEIATVLVDGEMQYSTYAVINDGQEILLSAGLVYSSSSAGIASIDEDDGLATGVTPGIVTITVTWHGLSAFAQLTVVDDCADVNVGMVLVIDNSRSMGLSFSTSYSTRLAFAKAIAAGFVPTVDMAKDSVGLDYFNIVLVNSYPLSTDAATIVNQINVIPQSNALTNLTEGIDEAIDLLDSAAIDNKVIILLSDGEQRDNGVSDPTVNADLFKSAGGIIICVGARASGDGYALLSELASDGYLLNGLPSNETTIPDLLSGLKGYFCAGTCVPSEIGYGDGCLEIPPGAQAPDPNPLPDVEPEGDDDDDGGGTWTHTATYTAQCPPGSLGDPVTRSATYTSTISQADAQAHAEANARAAAFAALNCCKSYPIIIQDNTIANPYPSCLKLDGPVNITDLKVRINGLSHTWVSDIDMLLVGPTGLSIILMSDVGPPPGVTDQGPTGVSNITLTFADGSPALPTTGPVVGGTFRPTNYSLITVGELPSPAPAGNPTSTTLAAFNGTDATGTWHLYVFDDSTSDVGSILSWELIVNGDATGCNCANTNPTPAAQVQIDDFDPQFLTAIEVCDDCESANEPVEGDYAWDGLFDNVGGGCSWRMNITSGPTGPGCGGQIRSIHGKAVTAVISLVAGPNGSCYHELAIFCSTADCTPKYLWLGRKYGLSTVEGVYTRVAEGPLGPVCSTLPWTVTISEV